MAANHTESGKSPFSFETQGSQTWLVYTVQPGDVIDTMSQGMLTNNRIPGLAPAQFMQMNTEKYIRYQVTSRVTVTQFFQGAVNKRRLIGVLRGITDALLSAEEYMLDPASILLDTDYIFADVSACDAVLICLPLLREDPAGETRDPALFYKEILFQTQFDQAENCDHVAALMNFLNRGAAFSLEGFRRLLDEIEGKGTSAAAPSGGMQTGAAAAQSGAGQLRQQDAAGGSSLRTDISAGPSAGPQMSAVSGTLSRSGSLKDSGPVAQASGRLFSGKHNGSTEAGPALTNTSDGQSAGRSAGTSIPGGSAGINIPGGKKTSTGGLPMGTGKDAASFTTVGTGAAGSSGTPSAADSGEPLMSLFWLLQHYSKENKAVYDSQKAAREAKKAARKGGKTERTKDKADPAALQAVPPREKDPQPMAAIPSVPVVPQRAAGQETVGFGETTVLEPAGAQETTVLDASMLQAPPQPHLIRVKTNERIALDKPVFRIGKERSYVDCFIGDNPSVSRSHANILFREGAYFVEDTNSTNHTYVNDQMIPANTPTPLADGDRIRLGDEEFRFQVRG